MLNNPTLIADTYSLTSSLDLAGDLAEEFGQNSPEYAQKVLKNPDHDTAHDTWLLMPDGIPHRETLGALIKKSEARARLPLAAAKPSTRWHEGVAKRISDSEDAMTLLAARMVVPIFCIGNIANVMYTIVWESRDSTLVGNIALGSGAMLFSGMLAGSAIDALPIIRQNLKQRGVEKAAYQNALLERAAQNAELAQLREQGKPQRVFDVLSKDLGLMRAFLDQTVRSHLTRRLGEATRDLGSAQLQHARLYSRWQSRTKDVRFQHSVPPVFT